ncbi:MAG: DJ-1/PfpI family protein [Filomicrobium sp.]
MDITKRDLLLALAGAGTGILAGAGGLSTAFAQGQSADEMHDMSGLPPAWFRGDEEIAFLLYPGFTALDVVGPHYMLACLLGARVHMVAKDTGPVKSDLPLSIMADTTFETCPQKLTFLVVPGGSSGTLDAMQDQKTIDFVKSRGASAEYVTSVCTGSLILGQAGLLDGYKATSHWVVRDQLAEFGAIPIDERYVIDRNRVTGAGVTAGIDFGLALVAKQRDDRYAKAVQLMAEYEPVPPFDAGTPDKAGGEVTAMVANMFDGYKRKISEISKTRT